MLDLKQLAMEFKKMPRRENLWVTGGFSNRLRFPEGVYREIVAGAFAPF